MKHALTARGWIAAALTAASFLTPIAQAGPLEVSKAPVAGVDSSVWSELLLGTGVKTSDVYTDGHLFLTIPAWSTIGKDGTLGGDYLFLEPYSSLGDQGELATSLGLGWRHLFSNQPTSKLKEAYTAGFMDEGWYIGGNLFVDMLRTHANNKFWQMGYGLEVGNRYVQLRGNYYLPFDNDPKLASQSVSEQTLVSQSSRAVNTPGASSINQTTNTYGDPYAAGNSIAQDINSSQTIYNTLNRTTYTTTTTTTVKTITSIYEQGMKGWDAELALLMPWVDQWMDVRVLGGYYHFDNEPFGPQSFGTGPIHGWKSGLEIRPVPAVVLDAVWYSDKGLTGSNWVLGVSLEVPMDKTWKDAFKMRRRHLVEDLAEPVHRMNDAIKVGDVGTQDTTVSSHSSTAAKTQVIVLNNTSTHSTQTVTIADDIIFVNNGGTVGNGIQAGSASGNGTAEHPVNTLQNGATLAGNNSTSTGRIWTAYVQGGGSTSTYTGTVTTVGSTNYFGSSQPIKAKGGKVFGGTGPNPILDGAIAANAKTNPSINTVSVQGFTIKNGSQQDGYAPIDFTNVPIVSITKNTIQGSAGAGMNVAVETGFSTNAMIVGNSISNTTDVGISLGAFSNNAALTALVQNNSITSTGSDGISVVTTGNKSGGAVANVTVSGNTIVSPTDNGVHLNTSISSNLTASVTGNTITNAGDNGVYAEAFASSSQALTVSGNTIQNGTSDGIALVTNDTSSITATVSGNTIAAGTNAGGVYAYRGDSSTLTATISGNTITPVTGVTMNDAIYLAGGIGVGANYTVTGNTISGVPASHFGVDAIDVDTLSIQNNSINNPNGHGILVETTSTGGSTATISGNTVTVSDDAIAINSNDTSSLTATVTGNTFTITTANNVGDIYSTKTSTLSATFTNNSINGSTAFSGLDFESYDSSHLTTNLTAGNTFSTPSGVALRALSHSSSNLNFTSNGSTITGSTDGILLTANDTSTLTPTVTNNTITAPSANGIHLVGNATTGSTGIVSADLENNTITNAGQNAILSLITNGSGGFTIKGNNINTTGSDAINISTTSNLAVVDVALTNNTVAHAGGNGIALADSSVLGNFTEIIATIDGNAVAGSTLDGINLQFHNVGLGVLSNVSSSINNEVTGSGGFSLNVLLTPHIPSNIILNGTNISPPAITP